MKLEIVKKKITLYFVASGIIFSALFLSGFLYSNGRSNEGEKIISLQSENERLASDISISKLAIEDAKKYRDAYEKIDEKKKKLDAVKTQATKDLLSKITDQYLGKDLKITFSSPEDAKGDIANFQSFKMKKIDTDISFNSFSDTDAINILNDFYSSLEAFPIVSILKISKEGNYSDEDLINISKGTARPLISVNMKFSWFIPEKIQTADPSDPKTTN